MRAFAIVILLALPGCVAGGGASPDAWDVSAEALAEGVLVKWNVPSAPGRDLALEVLDPITGARQRRETLTGADLQARLIKDLPAGEWRFKIVVTDQGSGQRALSAPAVTVDMTQQPVRPVWLADLGLEADLATPVLVAMPSWRGVDDDASRAVRDSLAFLSLETARVAFGDAYFVDDDSDVSLIRDVRARLLQDRAIAGMPGDLDTRALVVVDLRPALGDVPATLSLRLLDISFADYAELTPRPWNRFGLVFEDYVPLEGLRFEAGVSHSQALLRGFRLLYRSLASDPHVRSYLAAVAGGRPVFLDGQDRIGDMVGWIGHVDDRPGSDGLRIADNVRLVEQSILFMRDGPDEVETQEGSGEATPEDESHASDEAGSLPAGDEAGLEEVDASDVTEPASDGEGGP